MQFNKAQLTAVLAAASADETRYNLNGIRFESERMIATDGHRLHMVEGDKTPLDAPITIAYESCKRIIKAMGPKDMAEIVSVDQSTAVEVATVRISSGVELTCGLITGNFGDYQSVVPQKSDTNRRIIVNARYLKELCDAAIKAEGMGKRDSNAIVIELPAEDLSPIRVDSDGMQTFTAVLMPLRGK
jgi:DNA polymerase III sliding clamp (beta) subunit (PCNA family)